MSSIPRLAAAGLLTALAVGGCRSASNSTPSLPSGLEAESTRDAGRRASMLTEAEAAFTQRGNPARLDQALGLWRLATSEADDAGVRLRLARAEHFAAQLAETRAAAARHYTAGVEEARRALALLGVDDPCAGETAALHAPGLYWLAANLNGQARSLGLTASGPERREALCLARRAADLAPGHFHAGPLRLLGVLLVQTPALSGGDVEQSRRSFERAIELAPEFLGTRVDYAALWAVRAQDRAVFDRELGVVLAASIDPASPIAPENRLAQQQARTLSARGDALFTDLETY